MAARKPYVIQHHGQWRKLRTKKDVIALLRQFIKAVKDCKSNRLSAEIAITVVPDDLLKHLVKHGLVKKYDPKNKVMGQIEFGTIDGSEWGMSLEELKAEKPKKRKRRRRKAESDQGEDEGKPLRKKRSKKTRRVDVRGRRRTVAARRKRRSSD